MTIFWSRSAGGFYDDAIHGTRQLTIVDAGALDELIAAAVIGGDESEAQQQLDLAVLNPPTTVVDNPDCLLPADATEISAERHAELLGDISDGKRVITGEDGQPVAIDPVTRVEEQLEAIRRRRDRELAASDWTQLPDALAAAKRKLWAQHRQALRELPRMVEKAVAQGHSIEAIPYPEPPS